MRFLLNRFEVDRVECDGLGVASDVDELEDLHQQPR
jgi:hypothetical protein